MRILSRYVLRAHSGPFLFALAVLTGLLYVNTVARLLPQLAGRGLAAGVMARVLLWSLPHIAALTLPMAVLVAVLYAFSSLAADNEIMALKASGVDMLRLLLPVLFAGALLAVLMIWFNDRLLPETNHRLQNLKQNIAAKSPTLLLTEQVVTGIPTQDDPRNPRLYVRAGHIDHVHGRLRDVTIFDLRDRQERRTIYADSGRLGFNRDTTDLFLTLYRGEMYVVRKARPEALERVRFREQRTLVENAGSKWNLEASSAERGDRELTLGMLRARIDTLRHSLDTSRAWYTDDLQHSINEYRVEYHKKFAISVACIVFVLIGVPLAVRFPRGGAGMVIAISLAIFGIYYMSLIGGESLGDDGIIPPFVGPWAPNLAFALLAVWGLTRLGRETSTSRGGDWDDLWRSTTRLLARPFRHNRRVPPAE